MCKRYPFYFLKSLCYINNFFFFFFLRMCVLHHHFFMYIWWVSSETSEQKKVKKYSLSFPFIPRLFFFSPFYAGWIFSFLLFRFILAPKKRRRRRNTKSRELNVPHTRSKKREGKLILPKSGLCSLELLLTCFSLFFLFAIFDNFLLSPPRLALQHFGLMQFHRRLCCRRRLANNSAIYTYKILSILTLIILCAAFHSPRLSHSLSLYLPSDQDVWGRCVSEGERDEETPFFVRVAKFA